MPYEKLSPNILRRHKGISFTGISTVFFLHDGEGRIFLNKRSQLSRDEHGRWAPGAGGVKHGQSIQNNMLRELQEEFNVTSPLRTDFIGYFDIFGEQDSTKTHWLAMCFAVQVRPTDIHVNEPEMFDDTGWFTLDAMPSPLHSQFDTFFAKFKPQLQAYIHQKNHVL